MNKLIIRILAVFLGLGSALHAQTPPVTPPLARTTQGNFAGLLYASNFGQWQVPQGNLGTYSWNSPAYCYANTVGVTFLAFQVGTPITIVDTGNPSATEIVTPSAVTITQPTPGNTGSCAITIAPVNPHTNYHYASATAGLQETLNWAGTTAYTVVLTPDWTLLGGTTAMIAAAQGNYNVSIEDERTSNFQSYVWNGTQYVPGPGPASIAPQILGTEYYVDGFPSTCTVNWNIAAGTTASTTYTNSPQDCAIATASAFVNASCNPSAGLYGQNATVIWGTGKYLTYAGIKTPVNTCGASLSLSGQTTATYGTRLGDSNVKPATFIVQMAPLSTAVLYVPARLSNGKAPSITINGLAVYANFYAPAAIDVFSCYQCVISNTSADGAAYSNDADSHEFAVTDPHANDTDSATCVIGFGGQCWVAQTQLINDSAGSGGGNGVRATLSASPVGGQITGINLVDIPCPTWSLTGLNAQYGTATMACTTSNNPNGVLIPNQVYPLNGFSTSNPLAPTGHYLAITSITGSGPWVVNGVLNQYYTATGGPFTGDTGYIGTAQASQAYYAGGVLTSAGQCIVTYSSPTSTMNCSGMDWNVTPYPYQLLNPYSFTQTAINNTGLWTVQPGYSGGSSATFTATINASVTPGTYTGGKFAQAPTIYIFGYDESTQMALSTNPVANDTYTINGTTGTFVASGASGNNVNIGANVVATATNWYNVLSASANANLVKSTYSNPANAVAACTGSQTGTTLTVASCASGAIALNQVLTCGGCTTETINSGTGPTYTVSVSQTIAASTSLTLSTGMVVAANQVNGGFQSASANTATANSINFTTTAVGPCSPLSPPPAAQVTGMNNTAITSIAMTSAGTNCGPIVDVQAAEIAEINYGMTFPYMSDSSAYDLTPLGGFLTTDLYTNGGGNVYVHSHPLGSAICYQTNGGDTNIGFEKDTCYKTGVLITGSSAQFTDSQSFPLYYYPGSADYTFSVAAQNVMIDGNVCSGSFNSSGDWHPIVGSNGPWDMGLGFPGGLTANMNQCDGNLTGSRIPAINTVGFPAQTLGLAFDYAGHQGSATGGSTALNFSGKVNNVPYTVPFQLSDNGTQSTISMGVPIGGGEPNNYFQWANNNPATYGGASNLPQTLSWTGQCPPSTPTGASLQCAWDLRPTVSAGTNPALTWKLEYSGLSSATWNWGSWAQTVGPMVFAGITGSTQCLHVSSTGLLSGTGSDCGSGGGGGDTITSPGSTLTIGGTSTNTTLDIALSHANTWTGNQTSANWIASTGFDISGATTAGHYLRNNGTDYVDNTIQVADVPTLNQNTSGTAAGLSAQLAIGGVGSAGLSGTSPMAISSAGAISIQVANTSQPGYLASADWNTFNGKQAALSLLAGTYTNGDTCTYASTGTLLNCNGPVTANLVTASSPGVGLCHFAGSTQACTSSTVATSDIAANAVTAAKMSSQYSTFTCTDGVTSSAALATSGFAAQLSCANNSGATWTITAISCYSSSADSTVVALKDTSSNNLLSGATCTCGTGTLGSSCTQSGTTTIANGVGITGLPTPGGTSKNITWIISGTY
jgi:hypothetical protein